MGPGITNNESGKSPYALVIYCNNNLNILIVVVMMLSVVVASRYLPKPTSGVVVKI